MCSPLFLDHWVGSPFSCFCIPPPSVTRFSVLHIFRIVVRNVRHFRFRSHILRLGLLWSCVYWDSCSVCSDRCVIWSSLLFVCGLVCDIVRLLFWIFVGDLSSEVVLHLRFLHSMLFWLLLWYLWLFLCIEPILIGVMDGFVLLLACWGLLSLPLHVLCHFLRCPCVPGPILLWIWDWAFVVVFCQGSRIYRGLYIEPIAVSVCWSL